MIKFEHTEVVGLEAAIHGMRNPMNSWERSDSSYGCKLQLIGPDRDCVLGDYVDGEETKCDSCSWCEQLCADNPNKRQYLIGSVDHDLMMRLVKAGPEHAKYRRMIVVYVDITAPLYWWKEFDTYKVGTVANSCSTMHKIADKEFTLEDFSSEHLLEDNTVMALFPKDIMRSIIKCLNQYREAYLETKNKLLWWQMIQLLPSSYNQRRTVMLNYEVLANIYRQRKDHKLDEWREGFIQWIESLPYSEIITGEEK